MRPNQFYIVLSLSLVLFLLGLVGLWTLQAHLLTQQLREQLDVVVELEREHTPAQRAALTAALAEAHYAAPGSEPAFVGRQQALADLGEDLTTDLANLGLNNPLHDVITFNVGTDYLQRDSLAQIAVELGARPGVSGVYYQETFVDQVADNARRLGYLLAGLAALFGLVAGLLIHNTVRLSLYANRLLIKTQELVGASWGFISRPYLWRSVWQGILAGLLAVGAVAGLQYWLQQQLPQLNLFADPRALLLLYGGVVLLGVTINFISHYVVVRRYLRLRLDDIY